LPYSTAEIVAEDWDFGDKPVLESGFDSVKFKKTKLKIYAVSAMEK
jgi:hypothetical protein